MAKTKKKIKPVHIIFPVVGGAAIIGGVTAGVVIGTRGGFVKGGVVVDNPEVHITPYQNRGTLTFTIEENVKNDSVFAYIKNESATNSLGASNDESSVVFTKSGGTNTNLDVNKKKIKAEIQLNNAPTIKGTYTYNISVTLVYNKESGEEVRKEVSGLTVDYVVEEDFAIIDDSAVKRNVEQVVTANQTEYKIEFKNYKYEGSLTSENFSVDTSKLEWDQTLVGGVEANIENLDTEAHSFSVAVTVNDPAGLDYDGESNIISGRFWFRFNNTFIDSAPIKITFNEENTISVGSDKQATMEFENISDEGDHYALVSYTDIIYTGLQGIGQNPNEPVDPTWLTAVVDDSKLPGNLSINNDETIIYANATDPRNKKLRVEFKVHYKAEDVVLSGNYPLSITFSSPSGKYIFKPEKPVVDGLNLTLKAATGMVIPVIDSNPQPAYNDGDRHYGYRDVEVDLQGLTLDPELFDWDVVDTVTGDSLFDNDLLYYYDPSIENEKLHLHIETFESMDMNAIIDFDNDVKIVVEYDDNAGTRITKESNAFHMRFEYTDWMDDDTYLELSSNQVKVGKTINASVPLNSQQKFTVDWVIAGAQSACASVDSTTGVITGVKVGNPIVFGTFVANPTQRPLKQEFAVINDVSSIDVSISEGEAPVTAVLDNSTTTRAGALAKERGGTTYAIQDVIWSSSDSTVASIGQDGKITPKKFGKVDITAYSKDPDLSIPISKTVPLDIVPHKLQITLDKTNIGVGDVAHATLNAVVEPDGGQPILTPIPYDAKTIKWESTTTTDAFSIADDGTITALKAGTGTIKGSYLIDGKDQTLVGPVTLEITVNDVVDHVTLEYEEESSSQINIGEETVVIPNLVSTSGTTMVGQVNLSSSDPDNIKFIVGEDEKETTNVNVGGQSPTEVTVRGKGVTSAVITAACVGRLTLTATLPITVVEVKVPTEVVGVQFSQDVAEAGKTATATAIFDEEVGESLPGTLNWESSDDSIASVAAVADTVTATITAKKAGYARITAKFVPTGGSETSASAVIQVTASTSSITDIEFSEIDDDGKTMATGTTGTATAKNDTGVIETGVTWSSSDSIIQIDQNSGAYTANALGEGETSHNATITAKIGTSVTYSETITVRKQQNTIRLWFEGWSDVFMSGDPDAKLNVHLDLESELNEGAHIVFRAFDYKHPENPSDIIDCSIKSQQVTDPTASFVNSIKLIKSGQAWIDVRLYNGTEESDDNTLAYNYIYATIKDREYPTEVNVMSTGSGQEGTASITPTTSGSYLVTVKFEFNYSSAPPTSYARASISSDDGYDVYFQDLPATAQASDSQGSTQTVENPLEWNDAEDHHQNVKWTTVAFSKTQTTIYWTMQLRIYIPVGGKQYKIHFVWE